ncbi:MAG: WecB/TagA/CpsF family glycosyltransferase [Nitrospirae bacterium]|nr:WecB/TagA/CpsF family glycosyltransferase [Nitrospirota bacterium]
MSREGSKEERRTMDFLGVRVDAVDTPGLCRRIVAFAEGGRQRKVMYVNADCILLALKDVGYRGILNRADLVYADGVGVVLGARLWGHRLPGRATGADFFPEFCRTFADRGLRLFLLGAREGVAQEAADRLRRQAPGVRIVGTHHGYFPPEKTGSVIALINGSKPHILVVGFGAPGQEKWMEQYGEHLQVPVIWGVGGLFDFLAGRTRRGPKWLLDNGFEWLCRLAVEPRRLWRRYLIGNIRFILRVFWYRFIDQRNW